ncbi:deoxynucleoside kinase [Arcanobacterium haemolyticum]|uniref:Deoxynucleoside kinase n=1 Tax=Arcanobacterium haemolyticum (strain ATCC 9345 / DSM 20595 / CCM 5947 / CCUG 17215 / LMG 16163 / NBRC 15585 / NCTC 8452 / 11018) TaxID=644284 RepID=D7BMU0_ARCHD|nr:deoxynucleoside kinase [Arcanobacterium haemolyticum]ADH92239.1 deoxynucleoside kinase [Arcanobacterium haemolyticum DSM 20595]QCX46391.1 deoxynucleoside kinase [Arcanobacterium haemolyticum]SPT75741.1 Deoxyguanosine kinase [Arcanobacterium haemolyticum]SQH29050.1 Deoxyguanosine kinase [Arcanobacterium haemolyticum]
MLVVGGMIGVGKTTLASVIAADLDIDLYTENVDGNDILPLFYTASEEEQMLKRYPFLLQLEFLTSRYRDIKHALFGGPSIMDRSIYEDWYFAKVNTDLGRISSEEFKLYAKILDEMMKEIAQFPKKAPELMIYLHASFDTILNRIGARGRDFEQDEKLVSYYRSLWEGYDDWVYNHYSASPVLLVNADEFDFFRGEDRTLLVDQVAKLKDNPTAQYMTLARP